MASYSALNFQNASSPLMEELTFFHDHIMMILIMITMLISYNFMSIMNNTIINKSMMESQSLELFWTITPTFILLLIGTPSIRLLYMLDEVYSPSLTIKILGNQWYWSYEYSDFQDLEFDSFLNYSDENINTRLLDVDNRLIIPSNTQTRAIITASDVIHAWTIPSLGVKADAVPGRLNQINFSINRTSLYYGQCSEICGTNHSFMPIVIESLPNKTFIKWIKNMITNN